MSNTLLLITKNQELIDTFLKKGKKENYVTITAKLKLLFF